MITYSIRSGDTLSRIARQHGVRVRDLRRHNPQLSGVEELPGAAHNPRILEYHRTTTLGHGAASKDETPWCSSFVNFCMVMSGFRGTNSASARSWLKWGSGLP